VRRRGAVLERAILDAALEQLVTVGWSGLTMEGVAAGAQTGKAAVYRRWPTKEELVVDALQRALPSLDQAPDLGNLRADLLAVCRQMRGAMYSRPGCALRTVLHECDMSTADRFHRLIMDMVIHPIVTLIEEVVRRGIERGEVRPRAAHPYVFDVMPAMMMYRSKVCASEWDANELVEMIDRLMIPLLLPRSE
jgi:AcrR family transcriptional regulator